MTKFFKNLRALWNIWFPHRQVENKSARHPEKPTDNTTRLQSCLNGTFDFRHNCLTGVTEYRSATSIPTMVITFMWFI